jgi:hypothetical protein
VPISVRRDRPKTDEQDFRRRFTMQSFAEQLAKSKIAQALVLTESPFTPALVADLPVIEDWLCLQDDAVFRIHGLFQESPQRFRLSAAVIAVETTPILIIRCIDGDYKMGEPRPIPAFTRPPTATRHRYPITWEQLSRRVEAIRTLLQRQVAGKR